MVDGGQIPSRPWTFNPAWNTHTLRTFRTINLSYQYPAELTAVILEPAHPNLVLICCLSGCWHVVLLPLLVLLAWQMCVFLWSLNTPPKALAGSCSPALVFSTSSIVYPNLPTRMQPSSFTGVFMGWGQGFTKVGPCIHSAWPIPGIQQWLLNDWVMHTDLDFISNFPIIPRQFFHSELFLNESV